jgi:hypothetical protein
LALPDPEQASALAEEIEEALSLGDLEGLIETGEKLSRAPGPLAACGRRLSELGGAFDFDGLGRFASELRRGRAT